MNTYHPMRVFVIPMRLPGLNEYIDAERTHRQKAAKLKRLVQRDISACILDQLGGAAYDCPVDIEYTWYEPDRRRDKDNIAFAKKFINDALVPAAYCQTMAGATSIPCLICLAWTRPIPA